MTTNVDIHRLEQLALPDGPEGAAILAPLAAQLAAWLKAQGWTTEGAA